MFIVHFFGSLLRCREISNTIFCLDEETPHLLCPFSRVDLGTHQLESRRHVQFYKF